MTNWHLYKKCPVRGCGAWTGFNCRTRRVGCGVYIRKSPHDEREFIDIDDFCRCGHVFAMHNRWCLADNAQCLCVGFQELPSVN